MNEPRARRAAEVAELLRQELTHARIELERFERTRIEPAGPAGAFHGRPFDNPSPRGSFPECTVHPNGVPDVLPMTARRRAVRTLRGSGRRRGTGLGMWLMTLYLLTVLLSLTPSQPIGAGFSDRPVAVVVQAGRPFEALPSH